MQPVKQTINGIGGNCFPACIASILELSLDDVPHFFRGSTGGNWTQEQWDHLRSWAEGRGYQACWLDPDVPEDRMFIDQLESSGMYYVGFGKSSVGDWGHCVVMQSGSMRHDPAGGSFIRGAPYLYVLLEIAKVEEEKDANFQDRI